jgi:hypothetical protein
MVSLLRGDSFIRVNSLFRGGERLAAALSEVALTAARVKPGHPVVYNRVARIDPVSRG